MKRFTSIAAAVLTAAFLTVAHTASAQDSNISQRTFLTFSGPVQMPGITLPAGKYVFRLADTSLHNVMQVFDADEKHIMGQWFFIGRIRTSEDMNKADGKPVVQFMEVPEGVSPPVKYFFYPTDLTGKEFIYPKEQALRIASVTHQPVLATDSDAAKGGDAHLFTVEPSGTEAEYNASAASQATTEASTAPAQEPAPIATSGAYDQNPAPRQQASNELPKTASPLPLIFLIGLFSLAGGFALRLARNTN